MDEKRKLRLNQICSTLAKNSCKVTNQHTNGEHEEEEEEAQKASEQETHLLKKQQTAIDINLQEKLDVITSILNNDQIVLNSIQLINLIDIYYADEANHAIETQTDTSSIGQFHLLSSFFPCIACSMSFEYTFLEKHLFIDFFE